MKTINIKLIAGCLLLASLTTNSFSQTSTKASKEEMKKKAKVEKKKVPKEVIVVFYKDYPTITEESWYNFPAYDAEINWWDNWDDSPSYVSSLSPDYYEVEFVEDKMPVKTIYSKKGEKLVTHKKLKNEVPKPVLATINNSEYKTWALGKEKEEIFKDKEKMKVYKIDVEKGKEKHVLFIQQDGKLLKDKKVS